MRHTNRYLTQVIQNILADWAYHLEQLEIEGKRL